MTTSTRTGGSFTAEEKAAMKERAKELKAAQGEAEDLASLEQKIAEMGDADRAMAQRVHELVMAAVPHLKPKLWYGMPAYYKDGKNICFFQPSDKFKTRYGTLGFSDAAQLDDGTFWPNAYALTELTPTAEAQITELVRRAAS